MGTGGVVSSSPSAAPPSFRIPVRDRLEAMARELGLSTEQWEAMSLLQLAMLRVAASEAPTLVDLPTANDVDEPAPCPSCKGEGVRKGPLLVPASYYSPAEYADEDCAACEGSGEQRP
jgi:hypothetical protein